MTTHIGQILTEHRAVCAQHQVKSDIAPDANAAAILAADTRQFCPACWAEDRETRARRERVR